MDGSARRTLGRGLEIRKRFFLERDDRDVVSGASGGVEHKKRKSTVSRYQAKGHCHIGMPITLNAEALCLARALLVRHLLGAAGRTSKDHAAFR